MLYLALIYWGVKKYHIDKSADIKTFFTDVSVGLFTEVE